MRRDLPFEAENLPLSFSELLEILSGIQGDRVVVRIQAAGEDEPSTPRLSVVGELREIAHAEPGLLVMTIGDPEDDQGGRVHLSSAGLQRATLSTFDGNDFFIARLDWSTVRVVLQDAASGSA